jgi:hypothetical protein
MEKNARGSGNDFQLINLLCRMVSQVENGYVSIIKQDDVVIQINLCEKNEKGACDAERNA